MTTYHIVYWQDIPAMVVATDGAGRVRLPLTDRFQALIDNAAMRLGLVEDDAYLEQWHDGEELPGEGTAREVAETVVAGLEARFTAFCDQVLARRGSWTGTTPAGS